MLEEKDTLIRELSAKVTILEILHYGPKSEKWTKDDERQSLLFNEADDEAFRQADGARMNGVIETIELGAYTRRKKKPQGQGRKAIPPELPREEAVYDIDEAEKICSCGAVKTNIGKEISERVKIVPAEVKVIREIKLKYACKKCEGTAADEPGVVTAKGPRHLLAGSIADESMLAWCINEKYTFGLPLCRQEKRFEYIGLRVPRATSSNWVVKAAMKCGVLYELMVKHIKSFRFINADETRVQVLNEPGRKAQSLSWMWVFLGGPPGKKAVIFRYDEKRSSSVPKDMLQDYTGWIQTDDYAAYETALKELNAGRPPNMIIRRILCWQHARSTFHKAWKADKSEHAKEAIKYIGNLFALEALREEYSELEFFEERKKQAALIFEEFKKWLEKLYPETLPGSALGKAIRYTLDNWELLVLYVEDPVLTPSNNLAENAIRP
ncbi:MAG: IS66 family transposase, partial [Chitinispirillaceae bacterium]|nr:IS66 family transposase [Chitinispirillaceae bacterium]